MGSDSVSWEGLNGSHVDHLCDLAARREGTRWIQCAANSEDSVDGRVSDDTDYQLSISITTPRRCE